MIGIIGAMAIEVEALIEKLDEKSTAEFSGITYVTGKFGGTSVVVAQCGMGKVNAAVCAQTMILKYAPKVIINTGVAGSVCGSAKIGDIVIGEKAVQHDLDLTPLGLERGFISELETVFLPCTPDVVKRLESAAAKFGSYRTETIATGDQFISCAQTKTAISNTFGATACEMEGASIAHVCTLNATPFGIVRTISDNADDDSSFDFNEFMKEAAKKSVRIIFEYLEKN
ncbi:MAG: 5'-methylthioadenosine/adenosylhomocysteine nucleosidase [Defluviitaleaceae bacterium]|nr:5'-methylthioadenosine/adenosylhomocysteine nucleosidase [Defluviitaleaceae bacterium]MCL2262279.1 5'-methylthioadenosine/adenosylhomocysteine nucleosidase [Defluviitaleaceae bacterium]